MCAKFFARSVPIISKLQYFFCEYINMTSDGYPLGRESELKDINDIDDD